MFHFNISRLASTPAFLECVCMRTHKWTQATLTNVAQPKEVCNIVSRRFFITHSDRFSTISSLSSSKHFAAWQTLISRSVYQNHFRFHRRLFSLSIFPSKIGLGDRLKKQSKKINRMKEKRKHFGIENMCALLSFMFSSFFSFSISAYKWINSNDVYVTYVFLSSFCFHNHFVSGDG